MDIKEFLNVHEQEILELFKNYTEQTFHNFCDCVNEIAHKHHPDIVAISNNCIYPFWKREVCGQ